MRKTIRGLTIAVSALALTCGGMTAATANDVAEAAAATSFEITSPVNGATLPGEDVTVTGHGAPGQQVALKPNGRTLQSEGRLYPASVTVGEDGTWSANINNRWLAGKDSTFTAVASATTSSKAATATITGLTVKPAPMAAPPKGSCSPKEYGFGYNRPEAAPGAQVTWRIVAKESGTVIYQDDTIIADENGDFESVLAMGTIKNLLVDAGLSRNADYISQVNQTVDGMSSPFTEPYGECPGQLGPIGYLNELESGEITTDPRPAMLSGGVPDGTEGSDIEIAVVLPDGTNYVIANGKAADEGGGSSSTFKVVPFRDLPYGKFSLQITDGKGNSLFGISDLTLRPVAPSINAANNVIAAGRTVTGTGIAGAKVTVAFTTGANTTKLTATVDKQGKWTLTVPATIKAGDYSVSATQSIANTESKAAGSFDMKVQDQKTSPIRTVITLVFKIIKFFFG